MKEQITELLGPEIAERIANFTCPTCSKKIGQFKDVLSLKEFSISGMCQACQDEVFDEFTGSNLSYEEQLDNKINRY